MKELRGTRKDCEAIQIFAKAENATTPKTKGRISLTTAQRPLSGRCWNSGVLDQLEL